MPEVGFDELRELRARRPELIAAGGRAQGVRGFVIGRALLYPHDGEVAAAVDAACALVHDVTVRP